MQALLLLHFVSPTGRAELALKIDRTFNGVRAHNHWRKLGNAQDLPRSVSEVPRSSGHGEGPDEYHRGTDENYWGAHAWRHFGWRASNAKKQQYGAGQYRKQFSDQLRVFFLPI